MHNIRLYCRRIYCIMNAFSLDSHVWNLVEATPEAIEEFNRLAGYSETIIRHIVVVDGE